MGGRSDRSERGDAREDTDRNQGEKGDARRERHK